ncbi:MAG TPA: hypothetical protein VJI13_04000 [Candidatus Norongarragalinales archaeon]|nr:hypothetical protein [Candidatus Norongarragalinales archaeon]
MDFGYLGNIVLNENFIYALALMTGILWAIMRAGLGNDSFWGALGLAFLALIFLPVMLDAMQSGALFFLLLLLGGLMISEIYSWSLSTSILVAVIALIAAVAILPKF